MPLALLAALLVLALPAAAWARTAYVVNEGVYDTVPSSISMLDTDANAATGQITAGLGITTNTIAITPDGSRAYVSNIRSDSVSVIDIASGKVTKTILLPTGACPWLLAITPDGSRVYVANTGVPNKYWARQLQCKDLGSVSVIDTATNTTVGNPILVGKYPVGVAVTPDGAHVYVANWGSSSVSVISTATRSVSTISLLGTECKPGTANPKCPVDVAITPDGRQVYVANTAPDTVSVIDTGTNTVAKEIQLPAAPPAACSNPAMLAITPDGGRVYVGNNGAYPGEDSLCAYRGDVSVIDTATNTTVGGSISVGWNPTGVAITPDGSRVYVSNLISNDVSVLSTATDTPIGSRIKVGNAPQTIAIVPDQGPAASFVASVGTPGSPTRFDASGSSDPDGTVARYDWEFGDGSTLPNGGAAPSHAYERPGTYTATLTVTDNEGASTSQVFTGKTVLRNGSPAARQSHTVSIGGGDSTAPSVRVSSLRANKRIRRRAFKRVSGTATDASGIARVEYALARQSGGKRARRARKPRKVAARDCRFLARKGTLGRKLRSCEKPAYLRATGTTSWSVRLPKVLPRGNYVLLARATDTAGNTSQPVKVSFRLV